MSFDSLSMGSFLFIHFWNLTVCFHISMYRTGIYLYVYWTNWNKVVWRFMKPTAFDGFDLRNTIRKSSYYETFHFVSFSGGFFSSGYPYTFPGKGDLIIISFLFFCANFVKIYLGDGMFSSRGIIKYKFSEAI